MVQLCTYLRLQNRVFTECIATFKISGFQGRPTLALKIHNGKIIDLEVFRIHFIGIMTSLCVAQTHDFSLDVLDHVFKP